jgi:hypothetical protein
LQRAVLSSQSYDIGGEYTIVNSNFSPVFAQIRLFFPNISCPNIISSDSLARLWKLANEEKFFE